MKISNPIQVDNLLNILDQKPSQNIVHFSDGSHLLTKKLQQFCQKIDSTYYLYTLKNVFYDKSKTKYAYTPHIHIVKFDLHSPSYRRQEIKYDYIISTLDFEEENKNDFLEKCAPILCKGGSIIIITADSHSRAGSAWPEVLKLHHYVSVNIIDTLLDNYTVIMAKCIR